MSEIGNYYENSVFINYPIDKKYRHLFNAMVFAILRCGFYVRGALEDDNSANVRINKIVSIIHECRYGIHDLSRTQVCNKTHLPRFNMPFELGLFLGDEYFNNVKKECYRKRCLIFEKDEHSYEKYISDIKGQDIAAHNNKPKKIIYRIRDWLASNSDKRLPGSHVFYDDYTKFKKYLPEKCKTEGLKIDKLLFTEYLELIQEWLEENKLMSFEYK